MSRRLDERTLPTAQSRTSIGNGEALYLVGGHRRRQRGPDGCRTDHEGNHTAGHQQRCATEPEPHGHLDNCWQLLRRGCAVIHLMETEQLLVDNCCYPSKSCDDRPMDSAPRRLDARESPCLAWFSALMAASNGDKWMPPRGGGYRPGNNTSASTPPARTSPPGPPPKGPAGATKSDARHDH